MTTGTVPTLVPVASSNLLAVGYNPATLTLYVAFRPSPKRPAPTLYAYDGVPPGVYMALVGAPSAGSYLCAAVKGAYPYRRLPDLSEADHHALTGPFAAVVALLGEVS
jgi:hypothetical protein